MRIVTVLTTLLDRLVKEFLYAQRVEQLKVTREADIRLSAFNRTGILKVVPNMADTAKTLRIRRMGEFHFFRNIWRNSLRNARKRFSFHNDGYHERE